MNDRDPSGDLDELLMILSEGELTPGEHRRLFARLKDDPAALEKYTEHVLLNFLLSWERSPTFRGLAGEHVPSGPAISGPGDREGPSPPGAKACGVGVLGLQRSRWSRRVIRRVAAVCIVAFAASLGVMAANRWHGRQHPPATAEGPSGAANSASEPLLSGGVAVLTHAVAVEWAPGRPSPGIGSILAAGSQEFRSGIIQIEFYSGATLIVEGPAQIELKASDRVSCRQGKLRVLVPPQARGFRIDSPSGDVVDLGTEFVMSVGKDLGAEFHVVDGKVEFHGAATGSGPASKWELIEGEGLRIGVAGDLTRIDSNQNAFPSFQDLSRRDAAESLRRLGRWLEDSRRWRTDPRVVAHFSFGAEARQAGMRSLAGFGPRQVMSGAIVGCDWVEGRWPGKAALEFKRPGDRVRLKIPGGFDALTFMAWVRVDSLPHRHSALLLTDDYNPGEPHWQINQDGLIRLGVQPDRPKVGTNYDSPPVFGPERLGRWTHLATTYDPQARAVTHYVDGVEVSRSEIIDLVRLTIGDAEIGNWGCPKSGDPTPIRNLTGRMDEFLLLDAALRPVEVSELYERGRPGS